MIAYRGVRIKAGQTEAEGRQLKPNNISASATIKAMLKHICSGTRDSPFLSLSLSKEVAARYATNRGQIFTVKLSSAFRDPRKEILAWKLQNIEALSDTEIETVSEALLYAERDEEILLNGPIQSDMIVEVTNLGL